MDAYYVSLKLSDIHIYIVENCKVCCGGGIGSQAHRQNVKLKLN